MGMDQYIERVRRLTDDEVRNMTGKPVNELYRCLEDDYSYYDKEEAASPDVKAIRRLMRKVKVLDVKTNWDRLKKDFQIPENYRLVGLASEYYTMTYHFAPEGMSYNTADENTSKVVNLDVDASGRTKYDEEVPSEYFFVAKRELNYYRNDHTLHEALEACIGRGIENCEFVRLGKKEIFEIAKHDDITIGPLKEGEGLFYYAWW